MTPDQRLTLILTGIGFLFSAVCTLAAVVWRAGSKMGSTLSEVKNNSEDTTRLAEALDKHIAWHLAQRKR